MNASIKLSSLLLLSMGLNACLPQSIQGTLGKNNTSDFKTGLPEKSVFGEDKSLQDKIQGYRFTIKKDQSITNANCVDVEPIFKAYENQTISAKIIKSCAYELSLEIGSKADDKFVAYYSGTAKLASDKTTGDSTNVTLNVYLTDLGRNEGFKIGERSTTPPSLGATDLSIDVKIGDGSTTPKNPPVDPAFEKAFNSFTAIKGLTKPCLMQEISPKCLLVDFKYISPDMSFTAKTTFIPFSKQVELSYAKDQSLIATFNQQTLDTFTALKSELARKDLYITLENFSLTPSGKLSATQKASEQLK